MINYYYSLLILIDSELPRHRAAASHYLEKTSPNPEFPEMSILRKENDRKRQKCEYYRRNIDRKKRGNQTRHPTFFENWPN